MQQGVAVAAGLHRLPAVEPQAVVRVEDLTVAYGGEAALRNVTLTVREGEFVLVTGASGCGKTTLARCLNGLIPHLIPARVAGRIEVAGLNPLECEVRDMASRVGMVFQVPETQLFNLTVEEEVAFGCRNLGLPHEEVARRTDFALAGVGLEALRRRALHQLSGGEKQLTAIASVLAMQPRVMVLDEPLSSVDMHGVRRVMNVLAHLNRAMGMTVILIEHRTHQAAEFASRVLVLDKGEVVLDGGPEVLWEQGAFLASLGVRVPGETARPAVPFGHAAAKSGEVVVSVRDVQFAYRDRPVLQGVSLDVRRGEFLALVGDSGAGKTTLAHVIAGVLKPAGGTVRVNGHNGGGHNGNKVGLLLQNPIEHLFCDRVEEEIRFGPENFGWRAEDLVEETLERTNLRDVRDREVHRLSRGQQQRLSLATVLVLRPEVLILDEPTLGQDWGNLTRFMGFVKELQAGGCTVILITHDYDIAARYADRTVRLCDGRIVTQTGG